MSDQLPIDFSPAEDRTKVFAVFKLIRERRGRERAISMHVISGLTEITTREIQAIVKYLVEERHRPIGSSMGRPFGYFWITSEQERRSVRNHFVRRALSTLQHAKAYDADAIVAPIVGQLELLVSEEESNVLSKV
jgi:hypothetical protein